LSSATSGSAADKSKIQRRYACWVSASADAWKFEHKSHTSQGDVDDTQISWQFADPTLLGAESADRSSRCGASRGLRALGARPCNETPSQNPCCEAGTVAPIPSARHRKFPHVSLVIHSFQNHAGQCM